MRDACSNRWSQESHNNIADWLMRFRRLGNERLYDTNLDTHSVCEPKRVRNFAPSAADGCDVSKRLCSEQNRCAVSTTISPSKIRSQTASGSSSESSAWRAAAGGSPLIPLPRRTLNASANGRCSPPGCPTLEAMLDGKYSRASSNRCAAGPGTPSNTRRRGRKSAWIANSAYHAQKYGNIIQNANIPYNIKQDSMPPLRPLQREGTSS